MRVNSQGCLLKKVMKMYTSDAQTLVTKTVTTASYAEQFRRKLRNTLLRKKQCRLSYLRSLLVDSILISC